METKFKNLLYVTIIMICLLSINHISKAQTLEEDNEIESEECAILEVSGKYYSNAEEALSYINQIRKEACEEGVTDPRDSESHLSLSDYVPLSWSTDLEIIARIRACEAGLTRYHYRLNKTSIFDIASGGISTEGECLAWNGDSDMTVGIKQWYDEKTDWINETGEQTGHYEALINPDFSYVGLANFYNYNLSTWKCTLSAEFSQSCGSSGIIPLASSGDITQNIEVAEDYITYTLKGRDEIGVNAYTSYKLKAKVEFYNYHDKNTYTSHIDVPVDITFESSDESVCTVDSSGTATGVSEGTATISALLDGNVIATKEISVTCNHTYTYERSDYKVTKTCLLCGNEISFYYYIFYNSSYQGTFTTDPSDYVTGLRTGDIVYIWAAKKEDGAIVDYDVSVTSSNSNVIKVSDYGYGCMKKIEVTGSGIAKLNIIPEEDPDLSTTVIFRTGDGVDFTNASITLLQSQEESLIFEYTGEEVRPDISAAYDGIVLNENTDYTLSYRNNTEAGTGTIIVSGTGIFSGSTQIQFQIIKRDSSEDTEENDGENNGENNSENSNNGNSTDLGENNDGSSTNTPLDGQNNKNSDNGNAPTEDADTKTKTEENQISNTGNCAEQDSGADGENQGSKISNTGKTRKKGSIIIAKNAKFKITKTGKMKDGKIKGAEVTFLNSLSKKSKVVIPATIRVDGITYKVTRISDNAFKNNKNIKSVTIGKNVVSIGKKAFYHCINLKSVTIGKKVTTIKPYAFAKCGKLTKINVKATKLKTVGKKAFSGISNKAKILGKYRWKIRQ